MTFNPSDNSKDMDLGRRLRVNERSISVFPWPAGGTKVFAVIGDPIEHSLSPVLLNAAFTATKLDAVYVALKVSLGDLESAVYGIRALGMAGISVTMPHKESVIGHLDRVTLRASRLNSVNCIFWDGSELVGDSTDGLALVESLEAESGESLAGKSVMVVGTGGASRAIVLALVEAGVREIVVVGRREEAIDRVVSLGSPVARAGDVREAKNIDILVNATNVGMAETDGAGKSPVPSELLRSNHFVYDIIYHPFTTPLLDDALTAGARISNGIGMLVYQAARAFWIWTGKEAPLEAMFQVAQPRTKH